jgi:hypothetical protein
MVVISLTRQVLGDYLEIGHDCLLPSFYMLSVFDHLFISYDIV